MTIKCSMMLDWILHKKKDISVSFEGVSVTSVILVSNETLEIPVIVKTIFTRQSMILLKDFFDQDISTHDLESQYIYFISKNFH